MVIEAKTTGAEPWFWREMRSPVGKLRIFGDGEALKAVLWEDESPRRVRLASRLKLAPGERLLKRACDQLSAYFGGELRSFDLPLSPEGTEFQRLAWFRLSQIPFGQTLSYGDQARALGDSAKARAVGAANGRNPLSIVVPCHRVIARGGALTGFAGGLQAKAWLLKHESIFLAQAFS